MRYLALLGIMAVGCGGGSPMGPMVDFATPAPVATPRGPIVVNIVADGPSDNVDLRTGLALIEARFPTLVRFVRDGSGSRTISFRLDPAAMFTAEGSSSISGAWAQLAACPCTAEGEIAYGSMREASDRRIILHEIGHLFGLVHRGDGRGLLGDRTFARWPNDWAGVDGHGNAVQEWEEYSENEWALIRAALEADADAAGR